MKFLHDARKSYGGVFVTTFPDGLVVPWALLSIGDYIKYNQDTVKGLHPPVCLEDEIFDKCVVSDSVKRQREFLKAGVITTVVHNIWQYSGPTGIDAFNSDLDQARKQLTDESSAVLHYLVQVITMAFPYTPEQVYDMDYSVFILRVAQAEKKLLELGIIQEPISMQSASPKKKRPLENLKKIFEQQQVLKENQKPVATSLDNNYWEKTDHGIDFDREIAEQKEFGLTGHEKMDIHIEQDKLQKWAQEFYKNDLEKMNKK